VTIKRTWFAIALSAMTALPASGCSSWGCNQAFQLDYARDADGPSTPRAALDRWLMGDHAGAPDNGWHRTNAPSPIGFRSGDWEVNVVNAPAGGYLVQSGSCSHTR
jgi:hypothetical protein